MSTTNNLFSQQILAWFEQHGRHHLPWQQEKTPYKVWVSEIMLQQTQVSTVISYFERFMTRFPDVQSLATANEDAVLHLWTGLGYYARARNLHKTAKIIHQQYKDIFPDTVEALSELPGIGRSTAGAIIAASMNKHAVILDGNVKRVLCRYHCVKGWPDQSSTNKQLWEIAERYTPDENCGDYNQAMMDLGASLCSRSKPACDLCPLQTDCEAYQSQRTDSFPEKKPKKTLRVKTTAMLILQSPDARKVLLEKRPSQGIWGGLWSFPEIPVDAAPDSYLLANGLKPSGDIRKWQPMRHTFSHFHLDMTPVLISLNKPQDTVLESGRWHWYDLENPGKLGLAAPVKNLLGTLKNNLESNL